MGTELTLVPFRGIVYHREDGTEIGSITIRPEHIAFIASNWCRQVSRKYCTKQELLDTSREHEKRMRKLYARTEEVR